MILFLIGQSAFAQTKDTIFVKKKLVDSVWQIHNTVYIDSGVMDFDKKYINAFFSFDTSYYNKTYNSIKSLNEKKITSLKIPKKWRMLDLYKNEYFTYIGCESEMTYRFQLTDSTTINYYMDGATASIYTKIIKNTKNEFAFIRKNYLNTDTISIKMIDLEKGIAVMTYNYMRKDKSLVSRSLLVDATKASKFRSIVNSCDEIGYEFDKFDKINFDALLRKVSK